jgi:hypothetical protein
MPDNRTTDNTATAPAGHSKRQWLIAAVLVLCAAVVGFWEVMAVRSSRPFGPFELTASEFQDFLPRSDQWDIRSLPVETTQLEPNIVMFRLRRRSLNGRRNTPNADTPALPYSDTPIRRSAHTVWVRLVHGYNMCDCMRIKGYTVELLADTRGSGRNGETRETALSQQPNNPTTQQLPPNLQVWRLTSGAGDVSVWATSMLRAGDFRKTAVDVRSMAFPRVGVPDDPGWVPRGFTLKGLRHPIRNLRLYLRAKWNSARCDVATFLRLRQPAWASEDMLTLVGTSHYGLQPDELSQAGREVVAALSFLHHELAAWRARKVGVPQEPRSTER